MDKIEPKLVGGLRQHGHVGDALLRPIQKQHTVSRVVLRRFARQGTISVYDRQHDAIQRKGPNGIFREYLDKHDPWAAEDRWGRVETKMHRVYHLVDQRSVLDDPNAVDIVRDLIAIHWIRTPALLIPHERIKRDVAAESMARLSHRPDLLAAAMQQSLGLQPGGAADLDWYNRRLHERVLAASADQMLSDSLARHYDRARDMFSEMQLQIGYSDHADFVIGDAPVVLRKPNHDGTGLHQGVAIGDANEIAMPISPNVIVGFGPEPAIVHLDDPAVDRYNQFQCQTFIRWIGCRPGGRADQAMRRDSPARHVRS